MGINFGIGALTLAGNNINTGFSLTIPFLLYTKTVGIEYLPTYSWINGNNLSDHDLGLILEMRYFTLKGGYRWFSAESESLNGPFLLCSLKW